jgi:hypothetical protein
LFFLLARQKRGFYSIAIFLNNTMLANFVLQLAEKLKLKDATEKDLDLHIQYLKSFVHEVEKLQHENTTLRNVNAQIMAQNVALTEKIVNHEPMQQPSKSSEDVPIIETFTQHITRYIEKTNCFAIAANHIVKIDYINNIVYYTSGHSEIFSAQDIQFIKDRK